MTGSWKRKWTGKGMRRWSRKKMDMMMIRDARKPVNISHLLISVLKRYIIIQTRKRNAATTITRVRLPKRNRRQLRPGEKRSQLQLALVGVNPDPARRRHDGNLRLVSNNMLFFLFYFSCLESDKNIERLSAHVGTINRRSKEGPPFPPGRCGFARNPSLSEVHGASHTQIALPGTFIIIYHISLTNVNLCAAIGTRDRAVRPGADRYQVAVRSDNGPAGGIRGVFGAHVRGYVYVRVHRWRYRYLIINVQNMCDN